MTSAIETEGLAKSFGETRALGGIDMVAREGTVFGLLGPNGAGKTTTIRVLSTLLRPDEGRAAVGGYDVVRNPEKVRRLIGLTGQYAAVDELLSGNENLFMIGRLLGLRAGEARRRARDRPRARSGRRRHRGPRPGGTAGLPQFRLVPRCDRPWQRQCSGKLRARPSAGGVRMSAARQAGACMRTSR